MSDYVFKIQPNALPAKIAEIEQKITPDTKARLSSKLEFKYKKTWGDRFPFLANILAALGNHSMSRTSSLESAKALKNFYNQYSPHLNDTQKASVLKVIDVLKARAENEKKKASDKKKVAERFEVIKTQLKSKQVTGEVANQQVQQGAQIEEIQGENAQQEQAEGLREDNSQASTEEQAQNSSEASQENTNIPVPPPLPQSIAQENTNIPLPPPPPELNSPKTQEETQAQVPQTSEEDQGSLSSPIPLKVVLKVNTDQNEAIELNSLEEQVEHGDVHSKVALSQRYGTLSKKDLCVGRDELNEIALELAEEAANEGDIEGMYEAGLHYLIKTMNHKISDEDYQKGIAHLENAGKLGHIDAYMKLATLYHEGSLDEVHYIQPDGDKAFEYYNSALKLANSSQDPNAIEICAMISKKLEELA